MSRGRALLRAVLPPVVASALRRLLRRLRLAGHGFSSPDTPLTEGIVELRPFGTSDLDIVERAAHDSEIRRHFELSKPGEYLARYRNLSRDGSAAAFTICDLGGERFGVLTVELHGPGRALVGYWLLPEGRGRGLAAWALRLASRWALDQPGIARLELTASPENTASQRVAERSGYLREGVLRSYHVVGGRREDAVFYSLLPGELDDART